MWENGASAETPLKNITFKTNAFFECEGLKNKSIKSSWEAWKTYSFENAYANPLSNKMKIQTKQSGSWEDFDNFYDTGSSEFDDFKQQPYALSGYNGIRYYAIEDGEEIESTVVLAAKYDLRIFDGAIFDCSVSHQRANDGGIFTNVTFNKQINIQLSPTSVLKVFNSCKIETLSIDSYGTGLPALGGLLDSANTITNLLIYLDQGSAISTNMLQGLSGKNLYIILPEQGSTIINSSSDYKNLFLNCNFETTTLQDYNRNYVSTFQFVDSKGDDTEWWFRQNSETGLILTKGSVLICTANTTVSNYSGSDAIITDNFDWSNKKVLDLSKNGSAYVFTKGTIPDEVRVKINYGNTYTLYEDNGSTNPTTAIGGSIQDEAQYNLMNKDANYHFKQLLKQYAIKSIDSIQ